MNRRTSFSKITKVNKTNAGILFFFILTLLPVKISAQNYFGLWEGNNDYSFGWVQPEKVVLELYRENDSTIYGASHLYYRGNKYEHYTLKGTINLKDHTIEVSEVSELSIKLGFLQTNSSGTYNLKLACSDTICTLKGRWKAKNATILASRFVNTSFKRAIPKTDSGISAKDTIASNTKAPDALQRKPDIQSLIEVDNNKNELINIKIYDNGEIDQDSISLYLDNDLLIYKQQISLNPITLNIPTSKINSISKLKLIAESLGTIPPCTAVMIVTIGKKRYEINLSSDFEKNGVVEFFLK